MREHPDLPERKLRASVTGWVSLLMVLVSGATETLATDFRAVTLEPGQRRGFRVPSLERVTATSSTCIEEGLDIDQPETFWMQAACSGVRTAFAWRADGHRFYVMACAEDAAARPAPLLKLRQRVQAEAKLSKSQTACVRNGRVELWGWAKSAEEKSSLDAVAARYGDQVKSFIEVIDPSEAEQ